MSGEHHDRIARKAHELWEAEGHPHGKHDEHWQRATVLVADEDKMGKRKGRGRADATKLTASTNDKVAEGKPVRRSKTAPDTVASPARSLPAAEAAPINAKGRKGGTNAVQASEPATTASEASPKPTDAPAKNARKPKPDLAPVPAPEKPSVEAVPAKGRKAKAGIQATKTEEMPAAIVSKGGKPKAEKAKPIEAPAPALAPVEAPAKKPVRSKATGKAETSGEPKVAEAPSEAHAKPKKGRKAA